MVTVILTAFRRTEFLRQSLESVLAQTHRDFEVIVADDSASPEIRAICEGYVDDRMVYLPAKGTPLGACGNILRAIEVSRGKFVAILNDDDWWEPEFMEVMVRRLEAGFDLAFSDHWIVDGVGQIDEAASDDCTRTYGRSDLANGPVQDLAQQQLRFSTVPMNCAAVFRKTTLPAEAFENEPGGSYDRWFVYSMARNGAKASYVNRRLGYYRVHAASETGRPDPGKYDDLVYIYDRLAREGWFPSHQAIVEGRLGDFLMAQGLNRMRHGATAASRVSLKRVWQLNKRPKAILALIAGTLPNALRPSSLRSRSL